MLETHEVNRLCGSKDSTLLSFPDFAASVFDWKMDFKAA